MPTANAAAPVFAAEPNRRADFLQVLRSDADAAFAAYRDAEWREVMERGDHDSSPRTYRVLPSGDAGGLRVHWSPTRRQATRVIAWRAYQAAWKRFVRAQNFIECGEPLRALEAA